MTTRRTFLAWAMAGVALPGACSAQGCSPRRPAQRRARAPVPFIEDVFTGVGRGDPAIDTAAFALAAQRGLHKLKPGARYTLQRGIRITRDGAGFVCDAGTATLSMLTGPGQFDLDAYDGGRAYTPAHVGIQVDQADDVLLAGVGFELEAHRDVRCAIAVAIRGGTGVLVDSCSARGFDLPYRGIFTLQSSREARFQSVAVRDCGSSKDILNLKDGRGEAVQPQITGIEIDNDTLEGVWSENPVINGLVAERLELTGAASVYGQQTDGLNIQSRGDCGARVNQLRTSRVGEAIDNFSSGMIANDIAADDTYYSPIKLIHGASRCEITRVRIRRTGFCGVQIANSVSGPVEHNIVTGVVADDIGIHHDRWCPRLDLPAGVYFDGGAPDVGTRPPSVVSHNLVRGVFNGHGDRMPALVRQISPTNARTAHDNAFIGSGSGYSVLSEVIGAGEVLTLNGRRR